MVGTLILPCANPPAYLPFVFYGRQIHFPFTVGLDSRRTANPLIYRAVGDALTITRCEIYELCV